MQAVLGFVKVLVSCLPPIDLHHFLSDIMDGVLRWSSISRYHFKEKVCDPLVLLKSILNISWDQINHHYNMGWLFDLGGAAIFFILGLHRLFELLC